MTDCVAGWGMPMQDFNRRPNDGRQADFPSRRPCPGVTRMKPTAEEIVSYAALRIRHLDRQKGKRVVLGFMGFGIVVVVIVLATLLLRKSERVGGLFQDGNFLFGVLAIAGHACRPTLSRRRTHEDFSC